MNNWDEIRESRPNKLKFEKSCKETKTQVVQLEVQQSSFRAGSLKGYKHGRGGTLRGLRRDEQKIITSERKNHNRSRVKSQKILQRTPEFYINSKEELQEYQPPSLCFKWKMNVVTNDMDNYQLLADYFKVLLNCKTCNKILYSESIPQ